MRQRADIFEDYAKLAIETGLISEAEDSKELKKYKDEVYARVGSDDISTIEALYGVKPDSSIEYDYNIIEAAHPKPVVIGPAYDRINALVENGNERNNIMCNIVLKQNDGLLVEHRFAKNELMMELIRIANDMDNRGQEDIRVAADKCIEQLTKSAKEGRCNCESSKCSHEAGDCKHKAGDKKAMYVGAICDECAKHMPKEYMKSAQKKSPEFEKIAIIPIAIVWAAVVGLSLAGTWLWSHADDPNRGVVPNLLRSIKELDDLKSNSWYKSTVDPTVVKEVNYIEAKLNDYKRYVVAFKSVMDEVYKPVSLSDKAELQKAVASTEGKEDEIKETINAFIEATKDISPVIESAIANFSSETYQKEHTQETWLGEASSYVGEALHGRWGLIANDYTSVVNALDTLKSSLKDLLGKAEQFESVKGQYTEKVNQAASWDGGGKKSEKGGVGGLEDDVGEVGANEEFNGGQSPAASKEKAPTGSEAGFYDKITNFLGHKPSDSEKAFLELLGQ